MEIEEGVSFSQRIIVNNDQTAKYIGSGNLLVFATPAMVACMENTAMQLLGTFLDSGSDSVGSEINVKHLKPSLVGEELLFEAKIVKVEDKKVIFEINSFNKDKTLIGSANHVRYVIEPGRFMGKLLANRKG